MQLLTEPCSLMQFAGCGNFIRVALSLRQRKSLNCLIGVFYSILNLQRQSFFMQKFFYRGPIDFVKEDC